MLYGPRAEDCLSDVIRLCREHEDRLKGRPRRPAWDQRDAVLITYADQIRAHGARPLAALRAFLTERGLHRLFPVLHLLPFYRSTSDDGFSVADYRQVDPDFGDWSDVARLGEQFDLMFDLVLNHASRQSDWFRHYLSGTEPYTGYFVECDPRTDLSRVVRPRTSPLLTPFDTSRGRRHVWTTFSDDQVDLNYREPRLLCEMLDVLLTYIERGARIVRLDAVAFLWKEPGTPCVHLPQTHEVVKLLRDVVDAVAPGTLLLTETNVPHAENARYWGDGDEAHLIYNFSLPPLLLDALLTGDAGHLTRWLAACPPPPPGTTLLNFTASHDGIGVRPLESLVPQERITSLLAAVEARGGSVSRRIDSDGVESPYELNITYFDALGDPSSPASELPVRRFLASQALMLALRGIPAVYFHSLFGTPNDLAGVARTGQSRAINRRRFAAAELEHLLKTPSTARRVLDAYTHLLATRANQPAFHPDADQHVLPLDNPATVALLRSDSKGHQELLVAANVSDRSQAVDLNRLALQAAGADLVTGEVTGTTDQIALHPYQVTWLPVRRVRRERLE
jgi:sucrose phosphorylase